MSFIPLTSCKCYLLTPPYQDPRFQVVGIDQPVKASYGRTDKDLVLRHRQTGQRIRIEVKDVKPTSQRTDLTRIKGQIDKMAAEFKRTGELQAWVNRQETIPAIKEYAAQKGIPVYERHKQTEFTKVLDDFDRRSIVEARVKIAGGTLSTAAGVALLYTSIRGLWDATHVDSHDLTKGLSIGEQGSLVLAGSSMTSSGIAAMTPYLAERMGFQLTEQSLSKLLSRLVNNGVFLRRHLWPEFIGKFPAWVGTALVPLKALAAAMPTCVSALLRRSAGGFTHFTPLSSR